MTADYKFVRITGPPDRLGVWPCLMAYWSHEAGGWVFMGQNFALSANGNLPVIGRVYAAVGEIPVVICPTAESELLTAAGPDGAPVPGGQGDDLPVRFDPEGGR